QITYLEGYLWDPPHAKEAFLQAAKIAHGAERDVALTLSDAFCVDRYRAEFHTAVAALRADAKLAVVTRSEKGCLVVTREETEVVPAVRVERLVDATGAGD